MKTDLLRGISFGAAFLATVSYFPPGAAATARGFERDTLSSTQCIQRQSKHYSIWTFCPHRDDDRVKVVRRYRKER